ncbi:MAG TPA: hypothetical protein VJ772_08015 [Nitrososphaeraceae archaeon]|nr:hypothetical protein [Nitrososphaeraceae archaeon]
MIKGILLIFGLIFMLSIINPTEIAQAVTLLNTNNTNSTMNYDSSVQNNTGGNFTTPNILDSMPEDDESGGIASLPGKCLGSALCPD